MMQTLLPLQVGYRKHGQSARRIGGVIRIDQLEFLGEGAAFLIEQSHCIAVLRAVLINRA